MLKGKLVKTLTTGSAVAAVLVVGMFLVPPKGRAANDNNPTQDEKLKIEIGARIAPVPLTIGRKDSSTVYLGSYLVNAVGGCNDCHTNPPFTPTGNPYVGQPKAFNAAKYLGGGATFGPITSRNITPDATGKPCGALLLRFRAGDPNRKGFR